MNFLKLACSLSSIVVLSTPALAQETQSGGEKDIQVELGTTQESQKGSPFLTVRTLSISGNILSRARLELEQPFWVSQKGLKQNPTLGVVWKLQDTPSQIVAFHPQYDFGNPALAARRRITSGNQNLILPLEAEFGDEQAGLLSLSLGAILADGRTTTGIYSLGLSRSMGANLKLGTELEASGGQDLGHLNGEFHLGPKLQMTLDYAVPIHRPRSGDIKSLFSAGITCPF